MPKKVLLLAKLFLFSSFYFTTQAQQLLKHPYASPYALNHVTKELIKKADIPAIQMAVLKGGDIIYSTATGLKHQQKKEEVNISTVFAAASLSKPVFAYAVLQLVEENKLDLDQGLHTYLPYEDAAHDERYKGITARMVLSHTSGFPNWRNGTLDLKFKPGERFSYSGEGFVYLMKVVEHITGKEIEELMQERVFQPLKMSNSSYIWDKRFEQNFAMAHDDLAEPANKYKPENANMAHSLQTTAEDYMKFVHAVLYRKGLRASTVKQMLSPQVNVRSTDNAPEEVQWGLGWGLQFSSHGKAFWHWGDNGTFKCFVIAYPKQKVALVYFTNSSNGLGIAPELLEQALGGEFPSLKWIGYPSYDAPSRQILKAAMADPGHITQALAPYMSDQGEHLKKELIGEWNVNQLGYRLLNKGYHQSALKVFKWNINAFPKSANTYDSYAEAFLRNGNTSEAIQWYNKAYSMDQENTKAKHLVSQLSGGNKKGNTIFSLDGFQDAKMVAVAGNFNHWDQLYHICYREGNKWICNIELDAGSYQYKFVVDGKWILDPQNPLTGEEGGEENSRIEIKGIR